MAVINMNKELFDKYVKEGDKPVLVEFSAPWCVYCRRIEPVFKKIAEQFADSLVIGQVNIDDHPALASSEQIEVIPTFLFYKNGKAIDSIIAPDSKAKLEAFINQNLR